jgi:hypothetical protein
MTLFSRRDFVAGPRLASSPRLAILRHKLECGML